METGLTLDVSFDLAHFKVHTTMKSRASYLIPLPTTVLGFFFSILGKSREEYLKERKNFRAGAKLINVEGISQENAQLLKLKPNNEIRTTEEIMLIFKPKYRFAIWGEKSVIAELYDRIQKFDFEFVPYAGISEFIFSEIENPQLYESYEEKNVINDSYIPQTLLESPTLFENGSAYNYPYIYSGTPKFVIMVRNAELKLKKEIPIINETPLYPPFM
jgi:CRISPR-associated protein Cas5 subtype I-B